MDAQPEHTTAAELEELTHLEQQAAALAAQGDREAEIARQIYRELIEREKDKTRG